MHVVAALRRVRAALAGAALGVLALLPASAAAALPDDLEAVLALVSGGRDAEARAALDALLEGDPARPYGRLLDGVLLARAGRAAEAAAVLEALRRDRPDIPETYNNLAVLYGAEGRLDEARELLAAALERRPAFARAHENLAQIYTSLARRAQRRARELDAGGGGSPAALRGAALTPPAAAALPESSCVVAGRIETRAAAEAAGEWLRARGATAIEVFEREWAVARHRLYAGPLESRAAADAAVREARDRGVGDVGVVASGALANAVSFGVFRDAANARRRADALRRLGFAIETGIEWRPVDGYAVEARGVRATDTLREAWEASHAAWPIAATDCD